jgi:DedD protein
MARMQIPQRLAQFWSRWSALRPEAAQAQALDPVALARLRARRRLIGAVALVLAALIVFPLFFETQPRPLPADVALDMPGAEAHALARAQRQATPAAPAERPASVPLSRPLAQPAGEPAAQAIAEPAPEPVNESAGDASAPAAGPLAAKPSPAVRPVLPPPERAEPAARMASGPTAAPAAPQQAAQLPGTARFVVQIGAYAEVKSAQEVRLKVERSGLKTYTHVIDTPVGKRIRVRVGPLTQRDQAEKVLAQLKALGLGGSILVL